MTEATPIDPALEEGMKLIKVTRESRDIYGGAGSKLFTLLKKAAATSKEDKRADTNSGVAVGAKAHLMDKLAARDLRDFNATHSICLDAKKASSVGLGHRSENIHTVLDPLCRFSWQDVLDALGDDYWETGECFLEVAWNPERTEVTYLGHLESAQVSVELEDESNSELFHFVVQGETGAAETIVMAKFGDMLELKKRFGQGKQGGDNAPVPGNDPGMENANEIAQRDQSALGGTIMDSEIVHIRQSTNRSRYYGYPDYMSAVPSIELVQCMTQHEFDFYFNRGVPEFILFLLGRNVGKSWDKIENLIKASQGLGQSHKTGGVHIPGNPEETKVQLEKLAMEDAANSGFAEKSDTLAATIATAHGMVPTLANIFISGKMGANNEAINAMLIFQKRKLGQAQKNFSRTLAATLGHEDTKLAQPDGKAVQIQADEFLGESIPEVKKGQMGGQTDAHDMPIFHQKGNGFNTILDGLTLGAMQTMAGMKEELAGSGRNPADGSLGSAKDRKPGDPKKAGGVRPGSRPAAKPGATPRPPA